MQEEKMPEVTYLQKMRFAIFIVIFTCILPISAHATPPKDIQLAFNPDEQTLSVTITHASFMPGTHYIKTVEIKKNGLKVSNNTYNSQPDKKTFTYTYKIPAVSGDNFEVTASCNFYGSKTVSYSVK
jgi:hypothetical protein